VPRFTGGPIVDAGEARHAGRSERLAK